MTDSPIRVLLVEDNLLDQRTMQRHLTQSDDAQFEVTTVGDLATALAAVDVEPYDCVLLDLSLPDSNGLASVDAIIERSPTSPIVVLTGFDDATTAVEAVERGAQDYLTKQRVDQEIAIRSIRYAIARQHSEAQLRSAHDTLNRLHDRERIARDLHDTVIQELFATGMALQSLTSRTTDDELSQRVMDAVERIDASIHKLREAIFGLHAVPTAVAVADQLHKIACDEEPALGFLPTVHVGGDVEQISPSVRHQLIATVREALSNVAKHARATATDIRVTVDHGDLVLTVVDNGIGLHADGDNDRLNGRGLVNMRRRADDLSGALTVGVSPGGGTALEWRARLEVD